ncbi:MAG: arsenate reductase (glutaredoxin) [Gammaproteobacteria bacterium]|nr:arsenate reductase (glutaredoxin) [Gammaproteobacteria bacterium]MCP5136501.1 arsenate reductase (glutaredoxin) [Gammaproteobacteria bacterium]
MPTPVTIYHNPRCSKSRQTLALLADNGVDANVVEYLKTPPSKAELVAVLDLLGLEPRQLMRTKEAEYKEQGLADESLSREQLIDAMLQTPKLIERPIVIANGKAAIGRPPENVLAVLK